MESSKKSPRKFKNDADRIVHRHLENKDDKITEEDLKSVRIGVVPDETVETGTEAKARFDIENHPAGEKDEDTSSETGNGATALSHKARTPWDVIE